MAYTAVDDPSAHFKVQLYTGDGAANHAITFDDTDTDMQPDFVWIKNRDAADAHCLFDALRGATKVMHSDSTTVEATDADTLDSFTSDGFQVDADVKVNTNTEKYVSWNWKANGTGSSDTNGSINSTATSANTTAGFSIVTYTGTGVAATVGHGLGIVPKFMFVLNRDDAGDHRVGHVSLGGNDWNDILRLTDARGIVDEPTWNDTVPTTTLFSIGTSTNVNDDDADYVAYVWGNVQGFSKFGGYTGTANVDGPFIYTGFRPAFIMIKITDATQNWNMFDNKRNPTNVMGKTAFADLPDAEYDYTTIVDFLSNGFKIRASSEGNNKDNVPFIYIAFAEAPFVNSNGVPCTAR